MLKLSILVAAFSISLTACSVLPEPQQAPQQLHLTSLEAASSETSAAQASIRLAVERPLASTPLQQRHIWYRNRSHQMMPFSRTLWAESLDLQLQNLTAEYLAQQAWVQAVSLDQAGYRADYRLRLNLQHWYLDRQQETLVIRLQANLLDNQGNSLWQGIWRDEKALPEVSAIGLAEASQAWLEDWIVSLNQQLKAQWQE